MFIKKKKVFKKEKNKNESTKIKKLSTKTL